MSFTPIGTVLLSATAASITFSSIPADFDDLLIIHNLGNTLNNAGGTLLFNTGGTKSRQRAVGINSTASADTSAIDFIVTGDAAVSFASGKIYIANYKSSNEKAYFSRSGTNAQQAIIRGVSTLTDPITSITLNVSGDFPAKSIASLYGITKGSDGIVTTS